MRPDKDEQQSRNEIFHHKVRAQEEAGLPAGVRHGKPLRHRNQGW